ncbi:H-type lectin domain-containing protein [Paracoccus jiaweipingae]|uniref:H-type lectin domain-containing protein n=1 Tax=unclassified Paracoccus (in: a-proteobacteria) TaxID=2688777 RepID=UPI00378F9039
MLRFSHRAVGIQNGRETLFSDFETDGPMWAGSGPRLVRRTVVFPTAFLSPPIVHVGVSMWDSAGDCNQRGDLSVEQVTAQGFDLLFSTWGDSRVARIRVDWLAIGETIHDGDWDL